MTGKLCQLGYTEREAAFLVLASLQSGYFLRNQFNSFIGRECGAIGQRFIERSIQLGHVTPILGFSKQLLYHVSARAFYTLLGEGDNRNRREHRPETMRHRLMILDYVITRPAETWLLTDDARRQAFARLSGAYPEASRQARNAGVFHRAWRQPVSLGGTGRPRFAFVDASVGSFSEWEAFLRTRRAFLKEVGQASVIYASCDAARFRPAQRLFRRIAVGEAAGGDVDRDRLRIYFRARQLFEQRHYEEFDQARLDQLREDRRVYTGAAFEQLYTQWRHEGDLALVHITGSPLTFDTQLLPEAYAWLNPIRIRERRAHRGPDTGTTQKNT
jgi:hypothetical protein